MVPLNKFGFVLAGLALSALASGVRADETWHVNATSFGAYSNITGGINMNVTRPSGSPLNFSTLSYCLDRYSTFPVPSNFTAQVTMDPIGSFYSSAGQPGWLSAPSTPAVAETMWGRVSYIYNHYGMNAGTNNSDTAFATQLAIWDVVGELGAEGGDPALDPHGYTAGISAKYDQITLDSAGKSESAYYIARTSVDGYAGQALIANVTPEGDSLWMLGLGALPLFGALRLHRKRREKTAH